MKRIISSLLALGALTLIITTSTAEHANAQSPSRVFKQAERALGGNKRLSTVRTLTRTGTITRVADGKSGRYAMHGSAPNLLSEYIEIDGFEVQSGFNGKSVWARDSRDGLRTLTGITSLDFQAEAVFRNSRWRNFGKDKWRAVSAGTAEIEGKRVTAVNVTTSKGRRFKLFFDSATGLPAGEEYVTDGGTRLITYSDFRAVNGIQEPHAMRIVSEGQAFDIALESVVHNATIERARFDFPVISGEPLPDIPTLLRSLQTNEDKVEGILDTYSYEQKIIKREIGKDGVLRETESETNQLSFYKGYRISRMIEKNGRPLNEREQASEDREVQKRVEEIERRIAREEKRRVSQSASGPPDGESRRISIAEVLRASNLLNPRRERYKGRDVIVFDFEPNPRFDYKNAQSFLKFFGKTAGVMWIDEKDKQVARIDAVLFDSYKVGGGILANLKKGASFTLEQERVNDEIWLPSLADINLDVRVLLVAGININQVIRSYNYRKFETEVKDAAVDPTKTNP
jgi:hypothetical protein